MSSLWCQVFVRAFRLWATLEKPSVAHDGPRLGDRYEGLGGRFLVGVVEAGKPVSAVLVLALAPDLNRLIRIGLCRPGEIEPEARRAVIGNGDVKGIPTRLRLSEKKW